MLCDQFGKERLSVGNRLSMLRMVERARPVLCVDAGRIDVFFFCFCFAQLSRPCVALRSSFRDSHCV